jgi:predicted ribonuclease toxin of YeeF-YezG toxin-antitoxin module
MRNKELFEKKINRIASEVKNIGYHIHKDERDEAYDLVSDVLEKLADLDTLLRTEAQD